MDPATCQEEKHLIDVFNAVKLLIPWISKLGAFVAEIHTQDPQDEPVLVPVAALRFTHHTTNADFAFGDDHENRQESIFKLFLNYFWNRLKPEDMEETWTPSSNCEICSEQGRF